MFSIVLPTSGFDSHLVSYFLRSPIGQLHFEKWFTGSSGQVELTADDLRGFVIPSLPDHPGGGVEQLHRAPARDTEKERTKVTRGFDTDFGAAALAEGWRVHCDAVRKHLSLGTTPAEAVGMSLPDGFRWKEILERAVTRTVTADTPGQTEAKSPD